MVPLADAAAGLRAAPVGVEQVAGRVEGEGFALGGLGWLWCCAVAALRRQDAAQRIVAGVALQSALRALDLLVQGIALDVREHVPVHPDLVQVARAVVEPLHVPSAGHATVGAVAQRVVGMTPGVAPERRFPTRRLVLLHLFRQARERVVAEVHAGIGIAGVQHAAQQVVGEGGEAAAGAFFHAVRPQVCLGDEAPHRIAAEHGALR